MIFISLLDGREAICGEEGTSHLHLTTSCLLSLLPFPPGSQKLSSKGTRSFPLGSTPKHAHHLWWVPAPPDAAPTGKMNADGSQPKTLPWLQESSLSSLQVASLDSIFQVPSVSICMYQWMVIWSGISSILKTLFSFLWFKDNQGGSESNRETEFLPSGSVNKGHISKQNEDKSKMHTPSLLHKCDTFASHCGSCFQEYPPESFSC